MTKYNRILFLDDERDPSDVIPSRIKDHVEIVHAKDYQDFCDKLEKYDMEFDIVFFDHDIADLDRENDRELTGKDCAFSMLQYAYDNNIEVPDFFVHSGNPAGKERIEKTLKKYSKNIKNF